MKEIRYYVADDGTKFDKERECFNYEFTQKIKNMVGKDFKLFDGNYKEIIDCAYDCIYDAFAIQVLTIEGAKFLVEWADDYGTTMPFDNLDIDNEDEELLGTWVYDILGREDWTHLDKFKREVDKLYFTFQ